MLTINGEIYGSVASDELDLGAADLLIVPRPKALKVLGPQRDLMIFLCPQARELWDETVVVINTGNGDGDVCDVEAHRWWHARGGVKLAVRGPESDREIDCSCRQISHPIAFKKRYYAVAHAPNIAC